MRKAGRFLAVMAWIVGWAVLGLIVLMLAPVIIGLVGLGAVLFAPDMDGY